MISPTLKLFSKKLNLFSKAAQFCFDPNSPTPLLPPKSFTNLVNVHAPLRLAMFLFFLAGCFLCSTYANMSLCGRGLQRVWWFSEISLWEVFVIYAFWVLLSMHVIGVFRRNLCFLKEVMFYVTVFHFLRNSRKTTENYIIVLQMKRSYIIRNDNCICSQLELRLYAYNRD